MFLVVIGALLGALFGGVAGLFIGAALGYAAGAVLRQSVMGGLQVVQSQLIDSTFSIMGALCKADSVVTRDEINAVEQIFTMLRLQDDQRRQAKAAFSLGKQPDFDLDAAIDQFARISRRRAPLVQLFLQLQVMAVAADGKHGRPVGTRGATFAGSSRRCLRRARRITRCRPVRDKARVPQAH
jgi:DnaJ like chaperone protein